MANLDEFAKNMRVLGIRVTENADKAVRTIALAIDQAVVIATPVDTGRARSNWLVSLDSQNEAVTEAYSPGTKGSTGGSNATSAIAQGQAMIGGYKGGSTIYISNNLPYIQRLNDGWSAQAPAGYIEAAVDAAAAAIGSVTILSP